MSHESLNFPEEWIGPWPRGASSNPNECIHPEVPENGRTCEFFGTYVSGLIETGV